MVKVVLFTASLGDGHNQVASALQHEFLSRGVEVMQVDYFRNYHFKTARFLERSYEVVTRYVPSIYGGAYKLTSHFGSQHPLWRWTSVVSKKAVLTALHEYEPDIVLQLFPDHSLANLPRQDRKPIIGVVLTDYSVHGHWFHDNVDIYFLPHEDLVSAAKPFLSTSSDVQISGIPIRSQFYTEAPLNLVPNKQEPYILIATGGRGVFPNLREVILTTHEQFATHAVYVMCGRNKLMQDKVRELSLFVPNLHALPFIENVADWIRGASFSIIKSEGITVSGIRIFKKSTNRLDSDVAARLLHARLRLYARFSICVLKDIFGSLLYPVTVRLNCPLTTGPKKFLGAYVCADGSKSFFEISPR